jgi:translation initiation factor 2B subunit (eIF-2B alpha/beta/delta family)
VEPKMEYPQINKIIDEIKNDKLSGSSSIARDAMGCLDKFAEFIIENHLEIKPNGYVNDLLLVAKGLITAQPTMAAVFTGINNILASVMKVYHKLDNELVSKPNKQVYYLCRATQAAARKQILESKLAMDSIAGSYSEILKKDDIIMTISASGAIETLLVEAKAKGIHTTVYVPESRPMYEGRMLAQRLAERGINTILITDSAMFHYLQKCSKIFVGADRVIPDGIMNKIGTSGLAIAAMEQKVPFYCICETSKFVPDLISIEKLNSAQPEEQLYRFCDGENKPESLKIENIYFDFTPKKYLSGFLTEQGIMDNKQVKKHIEQMKILPELVEIIK